MTTALDNYLAALNQGMSIVAGCHNTTTERLVAAGCPQEHARHLIALATIYFGPTKYSRIQSRARATSHDLLTLLRIERHVSKLKSSLDRWKLRELLCTTPADRINQVAKVHQPTRPAPQPGATLRRRKGLWSMTITDTSSQIADLWRQVDKNQPAHSLLEGGAISTVTTHVNVTLPKLTRVVQGHDDVQLHMTNGATLSGAEFLQRTFTQHGYVTLIHPVTGPVNLYRTSRSATWKQRLMLSAEHHTCAWPGCHRPVEECQFHHIIAWKNGGLTNIDNLVPLCPYHNGVNDDDARGTRGRIIRINGKIEWIPPWANGILTPDPNRNGPRAGNKTTSTHPALRPGKPTRGQTGNSSTNKSGTPPQPSGSPP